MPPIFQRRKKNKNASYLSGELVEPNPEGFLRGGTGNQPQEDFPRFADPANVNQELSEEQKIKDVLSNPMLPTHLQDNPWGSVDESDLQSADNYTIVGKAPGQPVPSPEQSEYFLETGNQSYFSPEPYQTVFPISDDFLLNKKRERIHQLGTGPAELLINASQEIGTGGRRIPEQKARLGMSAQDFYSKEPKPQDAMSTFQNLYNLINAFTTGTQSENQATFQSAIDEKENELGRELTYFEVQQLFDDVIEAPKYLRGGAELAIEMVLPATALDKGIAYGLVLPLKGAVKGLKYTGKGIKIISSPGKWFQDSKVDVFDGVYTPKRIIYPDQNPVPIGGGSDDIATTSYTGTTIENPYGIPQMKEGLTRKEKLLDWMSENTFLPIHRGPELPQQIENARRQVESDAQSIATSIANEFDSRSKQLFDIDKKTGQVFGLGNGIDGVPNNPTIQDIAARLPKYWDALSPEQREFFLDMKLRLEPFEKQMIDSGIKTIKDVNKRLDVTKDVDAEGYEKIADKDGFYLPRGRADHANGVDTPTKGPGGWDKTAYLDSMGDAIDGDLKTPKGEDMGKYSYSTFKDSIRAYIEQNGRDIANRWAGDQLRNAKDADGNLIGRINATKILESDEYKNLLKVKALLREEIRKLQDSTANLSSKKAHSAKTVKAAENKVKEIQTQIQAAEDGLETAAEQADLQKRFEEEGLLDELADAQKILDESNPFTPKDFNKVNKELTETLNNAREFNKNIDSIKKAFEDSDIKLRPKDKKFLKEVDEFNKLLDEVEEYAAKNFADDLSLTNMTKAKLKKYQKLIEHIRKIEDSEELLQDSYNDMAGSYDEALVGVKFPTESARADRELWSELINSNQKQIKIDKEISKFKKDLSDLKKEQNRNSKILERYSAKEIKEIDGIIEAAAKDGYVINRQFASALVQAQKTQDALSSFKIEAGQTLDELKLMAKRAEDTRDFKGLSRDAAGRYRLGNYEFPEAFAKAVNDIVDESIPTGGAYKNVINALVSYSRFFKSIKATYDHSAVGVHGWMSIFDNPKETAKTLGWSVKAWGKNGDQLLGAFIRDFNKGTSAAGRLTSEDWARLGLRIGGEETEYLAEKDFAARVIPGIRMFNRAFGFYGDKIRLESADDYLIELMASGKSLPELKASGELKKIAKELNAMTGHTDKVFGGSVGELVMFAPRFFQARVSTLGKGLYGIATDPARAAVEAIPVFGRSIADALPRTRIVPGPDTGLETRVARRGLMRMIGHGTWLTFAINSAQGKDTDTRLLVKNAKGDYTYNNNFMKISFGDRDFSLFGPYNLMLKLVTTATTGDFYGLIKSGQGLSSGVAQDSVLIAQALFNEQVDSYGRRITGKYIKLEDMVEDGEDRVLATIAAFIENHFPISLGESPSVINQLLPEEIPDIPEGVPGYGGTKIGKSEYLEGFTGLFSETIGATQAPHSASDLIRDIGAEYRNEGIKSPTAKEGEPGWQEGNYSVGEIRMIKEDPRYVEYTNKVDIKRQGLSGAFDGHKESLIKIEENSQIIDIMSSGNPPDMERLEKLIRTFKMKRQVETESFQDKNAEALEKIDDNRDPHKWDSFAQAYYEVEFPEEDPFTGYQDWDTFEENRQKIIAEAFQYGGQEVVDYILDPSSSNNFNYRSTQFENPHVKKIMDEYEADQKIMKPWYKFPDELSRDPVANQSTIKFTSSKFIGDQENPYYVSEEGVSLEKVWQDYLKMSPETQDTYRQVALDYDEGGQKRKDLTEKDLKDLPGAKIIIEFEKTLKNENGPRIALRKNDFLLDATLYKWKGSGPYHPETMRIVAELEEEHRKATGKSDFKRWNIRPKIEKAAALVP